MCIRTRSWGRRFALEGIPDNSPFEAVRGAIFLNDEIVLLLQRTVGTARLSIARFRTNGAYVEDSFSVLGTPFGRRSTGDDTGGELGVPA